MFNNKNKSATPPYKLGFSHLINPSRSNSKSQVEAHPSPTLPVQGERTITAKYSCGFTLAEVLITLVIIGVIAALTVPSMLNKYQEKETVAKLKKCYSILSSAIKLAENSNGPIDGWEGWEESSGENALKILNILAPHLNIMKNCGTGTGCWYSGMYKHLRGTDWSNYDEDTSRARAYLADGISIQVHVLNSPNCTGHYGESKLLSNICGSINVDINGPKKPNQAGKDYFSFYISKYGLVPWGTQGITSYSLDKYCKNKQSTGWTCAAWVLSKGNMDYLYHDVSW